MNYTNLFVFHVEAVIVFRECKSLATWYCERGENF